MGERVETPDMKEMRDVVHAALTTAAGTINQFFAIFLIFRGIIGRG